MSHYFENDSSVQSAPKLIRFKVLNQEISLYSDNGVFAKSRLDRGTQILLSVVAPLDLKGRLLDLGAGYGPIGLSLAYLHPNLEVTMSDVNLRALALTHDNAKRLNLSSRVRVIESNVYEKIDGTFDTIVTNPPIRAGKKVTYAIYEGAKKHLNKNGKLYIVIRKAQGEASCEAYLKTLYKSVKVLAKEKGYYVLEASE